MYNFKLTDTGERKVENFLTIMKIRREEILEEGSDTANDTRIPSITDIMDDVNESYEPDMGMYLEYWNITDNFDLCLCLEEGADIVRSEMKYLKVEMIVAVDEDYVDEIRKWEHHIEYAVDMDSYPEIKAISGVSVTEIEEE